MKPFSVDSRFGRRVMSWVQGYDHRKYWRRRAAVVDPRSGLSLLKKLWYLYYIKKIDARHGCSFGTNLNAGATFESPPCCHMALREFSLDTTSGSAAARRSSSR